MGRRLLLFLAACSVPPVGWQQDTAALPMFTDDPSAFLEGVVLDASGAPVVGAAITTDPHGYETTSGAGGHFELDRLPLGPLRVVATWDRWSTTEAQVELSADPAAELTLVMPELDPPDGLVRVEVLGPDDLALVGASVTSDAGLSVLTDEDGVAWMPADPGPLDLTASHPDTLSRSALGVTLPEEGNAQVVLQLSGRPPDKARYLGGDACGFCHFDIASHHDASAHASTLTTTTPAHLAQDLEDVDVVLPAGASATWSSDPPTVWLHGRDGSVRGLEVAGWIGDTAAGARPWTELDGAAWPLPLVWVAGEPERGDYPADAKRVVAASGVAWFDAAGLPTTPGPADSAEAQCFGCHATGMALTPTGDGGAILADANGGPDRWVQPGVGCEACHGPGSAHVEALDGDKPFRIVRPDRLDRDEANGICAQCHGAWASDGGDFPYPWSSSKGWYRPSMALGDLAGSAADLWSTGSAAAPNQQADELELSPHGPGASHALRCIDCHGPHGDAVDPNDGTPTRQLLRMPSRDNSLCASCHTALHFGGDPDQLEAHPNHLSYAPGSHEGIGRCTGCHMPETAARVGHDPDAGTGDLSSHSFLAAPPAATLEVFGTAESLPVGSFPGYGCADCHAYNSWDRLGIFSGPTGDPTLATTHESFQFAWETKFED
jgi:hypothetical protein